MTAGTAREDTTGEERKALPGQEWADELVESWIETYKKSAITLLLLEIVAEDGPIAATGLLDRVVHRTGWSLAEGGLYRTLRRLARSGLIVAEQVEVARTGRRRQDFTLTAEGVEVLGRLRAVHEGLLAGEPADRS